MSHACARSSWITIVMATDNLQTATRRGASSLVLRPHTHSATAKVRPPFPDPGWLKRLFAVNMLVVVSFGCSELPNSRPAFINLSERMEIKAARTLELDVNATDPDGDEIALSVMGLPDGASFDSAGASGTLRWTPDSSDAEPSNATNVLFFIAEDERGASTTHIMTLIVKPSDSAPKFTTSNQRILDLNTSDTLEATIEVKDDDSLEVSFSLEAGPDGMSLSPVDSKSALLSWSPSPAQIMEKIVWSATILADDNTGGVTTQELSVTLLNAPSPECDPTTPPAIVHQPLADQDQANDYLIEATITDVESPVLKATLYWSTSDGGDNDLQSKVMIAREERYRAEIPNPVVDATDPLTVSYFICVQDNDDISGEACDNVICAPSEDAYQFIASPPAGPAPPCDADPYEPNDSPSAAHQLSDTQRLDAMMCQDDDLFAVTLSRGERLSATTTFLHAEADIDMLLIGPDQQEVLNESADVLDLERIGWTARESGTHYLQIFSFDDGVGAYQLNVARCDNDTDEPNDTPALASSVGDGILLSRVLCLDELDIFRIPVTREGTLIDVELALQPEDLDDVTMALFDETLTPVAEAVVSDNSLALVYNTAGSEDYLLAVTSRREQNPPVIFDLLVIVE